MSRQWAESWLETLKEVSPGISRALVLLLPDVAANVEFLRAAQAAGPVHNVAVEGAGVRNTDDVMRTMTSFGDGPAAGVVALPNPVTGGNRKLIADLAIKQRLSTIAAFRYVAASGALVSYGIDVLALFQSAAATSIASSRARSRPTCRCRRQPSSSS